jgi:hypothetical protein
VLRENELEPGLAETLDEIYDLPTGMAEHLTDAGGVEAIPDDPSDA